MDFVSATYRLHCQETEAPALAQQIALEQTVEVPESLLSSPRIREEIVGKVRSVEPLSDDPHTFQTVIDYPAEVAGLHAGQIWNLLYGNISLKRSVRLTGVTLPPSLRPQFPGPKYGVDGLREWLGVYGRPLLATALKPRGSSAEHFADLAYRFALGGGDLVKDDHNLVEPTFEAFRDRVECCQSAVERAAQDTGRVCLYAPNVSPPIHELPRYVDYLVQRGVRAALIAPLLLGFDSTRHLAQTSPLFLLAHPTFTGCFFHDPQHGIAPGVLLGQWFRLLGCDATIFPNHGGRFSFSADECDAIALAARKPLPETPACWPAPAGGMSFERLPEMAADFGADTIFLIGGALLSDSDNVTSSTRRFAEQIHILFPQQSQTRPAIDPTLPAAGFASACELPGTVGQAADVRHLLPFCSDTGWEGRGVSAYKVDASLPFAGVSRTELIGMHGEQTAFDVRYFEIAPEGYSSRERHAHTHVIIGLRGCGQLQIGEQTLTIHPHDIAYVPPHAVHQLRNTATEPFGFYCIVDHLRDRPQPPE